MAIESGHILRWRFQGNKNSCWLASLEMMMQHAHGSNYGRGMTEHTSEVMEDFKADRGSHIQRHAVHYGLAANHQLKTGSLDDWRRALDLGPVLAEGNYAWSRTGLGGGHVIVIAGVSRSGQLAFYNPNVFAFLPHPRSHLSYMTLERCLLLKKQGGLGPFWQTYEDLRAYRTGVTRAARQNKRLFDELPFAD